MPPLKVIDRVCRAARFRLLFNDRAQDVSLCCKTYLSHPAVSVEEPMTFRLMPRVKQDLWATRRCADFSYQVKKARRKAMPWSFNMDLDRILRKFYPWLWRNSNVPLSGQFSTQCCAQFITSRHQIHMRPLSFWRYMRSIVMDHTLCTYTDTGRYNNGRTYSFYGHLFERLWGAMLGQPPRGNPREQLVQNEEAKALAQNNCRKLST